MAQLFEQFYIYTIIIFTSLTYIGINIENTHIIVTHT